MAAQLEAMNLGQATHNLGQPSHTIGQSADNHSLGHPNPNNPQAQEQIPSNGQNGQQTPNSIATTAPASQSFQPGTTPSQTPKSSPFPVLDLRRSACFVTQVKS